MAGHSVTAADMQRLFGRLSSCAPTVDLSSTSEEDCQSGGNRNLDILVGKLALCRSLVTGFFLARRTFFSLVNAAVYDHGSVWAMDFFLTV